MEATITRARTAPEMTRERMLALARQVVLRGLIVLVVEPGRNAGAPRTVHASEGSDAYYFHMSPTDVWFGTVSAVADVILRLKPSLPEP